MSNARRLGLFALASIPLSLAASFGLTQLYPYFPILDSAGGNIFYGVLVVGCAALGLAFGVWGRGQPPIAKLLAALLCLVAPMAGMFLMVGLACVTGTDCM